MWMINAADRGILPDYLIRMGIRHLDRMRLRQENRGSSEARQQALSQLIDLMDKSTIAVETRKANQQHYELPPEFFIRVLGSHLKYSGCYWPDGCPSLDQAEANMLEMTCERAEIRDGLEILDLGCGWGSLSLWMASHYPNSRILAVSNSTPQRKFIQKRASDRNLSNLEVKTADINVFDTGRRFDRVVSVEMFEHMRNWRKLLQNIDGWLKSKGKLFVHIFTHRAYAYLFETEGDHNWMGRHFFTGGIMPSDGLLYHFQDHLTIESHWRVDGRHYQKTAEAWLKNLDTQRQVLLPIMADVYGRDNAARWLRRWRIFFMACAELWGFRKGKEWQVSHYRLRKK